MNNNNNQISTCPPSLLYLVLISHDLMAHCDWSPQINAVSGLLTAERGGPPEDMGPTLSVFGVRTASGSVI